MPDRFMAVVEIVNATFDSQLSALAASPVFPWINTTAKAVGLVVTTAVTLVMAGFGAALLLSEFRTLPERVTVVEVQSTQTRGMVCEIWIEVKGINRDPLECWRDESAGIGTQGGAR